MRIGCRLVTAVLLALAAASPSSAGPPPALTARRVVERIRQDIGVPWAAETVDTFKDGDPDTAVTGIAVTMMATLDVLRQASAAGANLVITHEPTFYGHLDDLEALEKDSDTVTAAKRAFIREHRLVVVRMHDHWHRRQPDGIGVGMARALGWEAFRRPGTDFLFSLPETTLGRLAATVRDRLGSPTLRVVGDPGLRVSGVAFAPGFAGFAPHRLALQRDDVQVLVIGEAHEWETVAYAADAIAAHQPKALIVIGHIPSEQAGMEEFTRWLETRVREVPVRFIAARDPFWSP